MRTYIYIDGFNFYYGAVKDTPYKWLDFKKLFNLLLDPKHKILSIKYFTAMVTGKIDPGQPIRQKTFLRALKKYIPEISIHYGKFLSHNVFKPLAYPINKNLFGKNIRFANIIKTEEKGSDVNLALNLLNDAWLDLYDCAVVVSNDSDLAESLRLVKTQHKKMIGLITPGKTHPSKELMQYADFNKRIREGVLATSQLPDPIPGSKLRKPTTW
jgi:uncharacterized LabA/DUF88 family protein